MGAVGIIVTVVVAGIVFLVQEIRMKNALQQQRLDLRKDFRADLKEALLENTKTIWNVIQGKPVTKIEPELEAKFAGIAETTAAAWFSGAALLPEALAELRLGDFLAFGNKEKNRGLIIGQEFKDAQEYKLPSDEDAGLPPTKKSK